MAKYSYATLSQHSEYNIAKVIFLIKIVLVWCCPRGFNNTAQEKIPDQCSCCLNTSSSDLPPSLRDVCFMQQSIKFMEVWHIMWLLTGTLYLILLSHTQTHIAHLGASRLTHPYKYKYYLLCAHIRSSHSEVFLKKGVLKIYSKFTEHSCRSAISIKLLWKCQVQWRGTTFWRLKKVF